MLGAPFAIGPDDKPLIIEYNYDRSLEELHFTDMTIPSFDFLAEFKNLKFLSITSCAVPEGVTLPRLETLTGLSVCHTEGADAFSLVKDCLPLPNLKSLSLVDSEEGFVLPRIDTLERLEISVPNVLEIIANNHHVLTLLLGDGTLGLQNLNGLERFKNMTYLSVLEDVRDISALSGCESLRLLIVDHASGLRTLKPLYNLEHLEEIIMDQAAYRYLPQEDKDHFSGENRDAARIYFYD